MHIIPHIPKEGPLETSLYSSIEKFLTLLGAQDRQFPRHLISCLHGEQGYEIALAEVIYYPGKIKFLNSEVAWHPAQADSIMARKLDEYIALAKQKGEKSHIFVINYDEQIKQKVENICRRKGIEFNFTNPM